MNNILAAKVLMSHLPEIADDEYRKATEFAIKSLLSTNSELLPTMMYQEKKVKSTDEMLVDIQDLEFYYNDKAWFRLNEDTMIFIQIIIGREGMWKVVLTLQDADGDKLLDSFICDYDNDVEIKNALNYFKEYVLG